MLTYTLILEHLWNTKLSCQPGVKHFCTRERSFFLNILKVSLAHSHQEGPYQAMFVGTQQQKKQSKLNTRKRKGQDATKITSAPAESCIQFPWSVMPISTTALTWMVRNNPNRTPSRISQRRSMKQNLSDNATLLTC